MIFFLYFLKEEIVNLCFLTLKKYTIMNVKKHSIELEVQTSLWEIWPSNVLKPTGLRKE